MTPERAREVAERIVDRWVMQPGHPDIPIYARQPLYDAIASALLAAAQVPEGCVRLPDGRDVRVLGRLAMTKDDCAIGIGASLWPGPIPDDGDMFLDAVGHWVTPCAIDGMGLKCTSYRHHRVISSQWCYGDELKARAAAESARAAGKEQP